MRRLRSWSRAVSSWADGITPDALNYSLGLVGLLLAVVPVVSQRPVAPAGWVVVLGGALVFALALVKILGGIMRRRSETVVARTYLNLSRAHRYWVPNQLKSLDDEELLQVVARTAFRWLCGNEQDLQNHEPRYHAERERRQCDIIETINRSNSVVISFVLQCPHVQMDWWEGHPERVTKNRDQFDAAVRSLLEIKGQLALKTHRLKLQITSRPVPNSVTRVVRTDMSERRVRLLLVDLGDPAFLSEGGGLMVKPCVVFEARDSHIDLDYYDRIFDKYLQASPDCPGCPHECSVKPLVALGGLNA